MRKSANKVGNVIRIVRNNPNEIIVTDPKVSFTVHVLMETFSTLDGDDNCELCYSL